MSTTPYTPRAGSLPAQVVAFFQRNPDEVLTLDDITSKFDCSRGNIHTMLALAVEAQLIQRKNDDEAGYLYVSGPNNKPAATNAGLSATAAKPKRSAPRAWTMPDLHSIQLDAGLPVARSTRTAIDWKPLLDRMHPGHSAELPMPAKASLTKAVTERHKATAQRFTVGKVNDTTLRIWRTV